MIREGKGFETSPTTELDRSKVMATQPFMSLRLVGGRFDEHSIPLSFLKRLSSLEGVVTELAKASFIVDNPNEAVPRGLTRGVGLGLTAVGKGSAVADIGIVSTGQASRLTRHYFNDGCYALVDIMAGAEYDAPFPQNTPPRVITSFFRGIGRELRHGDSIEISTRFLLNKTIRLARESNLLNGEIPAANSVPITLDRRDLAVSGHVPSADQLDMVFRMLLPDGRFATAPIDHENRGIVLQAFDGYEVGAQLHVEGTGTVRRTVPQLVFDTISRVRLVEPRTDTAGQINRLRSLEDGWLEGESKAPSSEGLDWLSQAFDRHYSTNLPTPYIYPTEEGGVQSEWTFGTIDINVRIDLSTQRAVYFWLDEHTEEERGLNLADRADWEWLALNIRKYAEQ